MKLTIFTPTFNRAYILGNLYSSLRKQTSRAFEWVIVDDGSTDDTETLVNGWIAEADFDIVYRKQSNQGKHIAINEGVRLASEELFFIVDSDDHLSEDATEKILLHWQEHGANRLDVSGILSYRKFPDGRFVGTLLPSNVQYCTLRDSLKKYHSHGDKVVIYRTDILRQYPYPQFAGENFLGESYVYNQIDEKYKMSVMNDAVYWFDYQNDGLSRDFRRLYRNNPQGFYLIYAQNSRYLTNVPEKLKNAAHLDALAIRLGKRVIDKPNRFWRLMALPLGIFMYLKIFVFKVSDVKWYLHGTKIMNKKKLLFVMDTFPLGGIAKSLLALLHELGSEEYDIDFLLMKREGFLLPLLPAYVHLLPEPLEEEFRSPHPRFIFKNFLKMPFRRWLLWVKFSLLCSWSRVTGGLHKHICCLDQFVAKHSAPQPGEYDAAIAYAGGRCIYYVAMRVKAPIKIGYVHSDYRINEMDYMLKPTDMIYFPQMDHLITISEQCLESLRVEFPMLASRCHVIENICSPRSIRSLADSGTSFSDQWDGFRLATMGRLDIFYKGLDWAIEACALLKEKKIPIRWYVLGDGVARNELQKMIDDRGLHDTFILLGPQINPYPFIKDCDVYVQPSRVEGKSVALDEVKALAKPIVVTRFSTVLDQFRDNETALIAEMTPESIAEKIAMLLDNEELRDVLHRNLTAEKVGNEEQVELFKKYITSK